MAKRKEHQHKRTPRITMPDEVDLTTYNSLLISFTNGKEEILNIHFCRELADDSAELYVNIIGPTGEIATTLTIFDLKV